ncbi:MAG TPA: hypothetical protein VK919_07925 [Solirubrobacterales bacterium]|nr:hypothetical protein [Solirubrobacterales bacterium]
MVRAIGTWIWRALSAVSVLVSLGGALVVAAIVSAALDLDPPWNVVLAVGVFFLVAGAIRAAWDPVRASLLRPFVKRDIEALIAEGRVLVDELSEPPEGGRIVIGGGPTGPQGSRVPDLRARALGDARPASGPRFERAANGFLERDRKKRAKKWGWEGEDPPEEVGVEEVGVEEFNERITRAPLIRVQATLHGLAEALDRLSP